MAETKISGMIHGFADTLAKLPTLAHKTVDKVVHTAQALPTALQSTIHDSVQLGHRSSVELDKHIVRSQYKMEKHLGISKAIDPTIPGLKDDLQWLGGKLKQAGEGVKDVVDATVENGGYALQAGARTVLHPLQSIQDARSFYPEYAKNAKGFFHVLAGAGAGGAEAANGLVGLGALGWKAAEGTVNLGRYIGENGIHAEDLKAIGRKSWELAGRGADYAVNEAPTDISNHVKGWIQDPGYNITKDVVNVGTSLLTLGGVSRVVSGGLSVAGLRTAAAVDAAGATASAMSAEGLALCETAGGSVFSSVTACGDAALTAYERMQAAFARLLEGGPKAPRIPKPPVGPPVTPLIPAPVELPPLPNWSNNINILQNELNSYRPHTTGLDITI